MKPEQSEIAQLKRDVAELKAERDILITYGRPHLQG
jgi:transposase